MENIIVSQRKPTSARFLLIVGGESEATWKGLQKTIKQEASYLTLVAQTSEEAMHFARNIQPSLVLIQHHLPDVNGMELYRRLKTITPEKALPVLMITKEGERMPHDHFPELHLLEEPYSLDILLKCLKHLSME